MKCERLILEIQMETALMTVIKRDRVNRIGEEAWDRDKNSLLLDYHIQ